MKLTTKSYAKINLGLWILEKRPDNFHNLETIFQEIPLCDEISIESAQTKTLYCPPFPGRENLIFKAWESLENHLERKLPASISVVKRIPDQAGLGGGSSNAATALRLLNEFFDLKISNNDLINLASQFGSDTSFFVQGGCQFGEGRGERLTPLPHSLNAFVLLGVPEFGLSTKDVFQALKVKLTSQKRPANIVIKELERSGNPSSFIHNDLLSTSLSLEPRLESFMNTLSDMAQSSAHLSGSGSSCFSLLENPIEPPKHFHGRLLTLLDIKENKILWSLRP